jgi:hypothetical protein
MPIQVQWEDTAHTLVRLQFERGWTWNDLYAAVEQADRLITSVPHTVHLLIDIRHAGGLPGDFMRRAGDLFAQGEARANEGRKVVIGAGPLIRAAYSGFLKVYGGQMKNRPLLFAGDMDEARRLLSAG